MAPRSLLVPSRTSAEVLRVWPAERLVASEAELSSAMSEVISLVLLAILPMLRVISPVAEPCSATATLIDVVKPWTSCTVFTIAWMASAAAPVSVWIEEICFEISSVALAV